MKTLNQFQQELKEQTVPKGFFKGIEGTVIPSKGIITRFEYVGDRTTAMQQIQQNMNNMGVENTLTDKRSSIGSIEYVDPVGKTRVILVKHPVGARGPSGEDWEALIVVGMNANQGRKWDSGPEWERIKEFWGSYEDSARKVAQSMSKDIGITSLTQTGSSRASLSSEWTKWGATNKTPKTDLLGNNGRYKISLKKSGGSQLMSGFKEETIATIYAAMQTYSADSKGKQEIQKVMRLLEEKMVKLSSKSTVSSINKLKKKDSSLLSPEDLAKIEELDRVQLDAKEINSALDKLFDNEIFKAHVCFEAATGNYKFGADSEAASNLMVTFNENGSLDHVLNLTDPEKAGMVLAKTNKIYVSFKSSSGSPPYLSLRTNKIDDPKKWIRKLKLTETFEDIIREETQGLQFLGEDLQQLDEFKILNRLRNVAGELINKAKEVLARIVERIRGAFTYILSLGSKALNALVRFFGFEVSKVDYKQSKIYPLFDD